MTRARAAIAFLAILVTSTSVVAQTYDLRSDWNTISNPNGAWILREGSNVLPFITDWTALSLFEPTYNQSGHVAQPAFAYGSAPGNHVPAWFQSTVTPVAPGLVGTFDWQLDDVLVHTTDSFNGPGRGDANVLWTSPSGGTAHIFGSVWDARTDLNRSNIWELWVTQGAVSSVLGSGYLAGNNLDAFSRAAPAAFDFSNVVLAANDTVMLKFYRAGEVGDFIGVNFTVDVTTPIPEPETYVMLLAGLGLLGFHARRRRLKSVQA